jgi:ketosteroid isomerase-like protein
MNAARNKKLMNDIFLGLSEGKSDLLLQSLDETVRWTTPGPGRWFKTYEGKPAILELFRSVMSRLIPPFKATAQRLIADDDHVVVQLRGSGNRTKSGGTYDNHYCWVCQLRNGKIVSVTEYCDTELSTAALGTL